MEPICLFEAGGTKTTLLIAVNDAVHKHELPGFNPNRYSPDFEQALIKLNLPAEAHVIFYGSGLATDSNKQTVEQLLAKKFNNPAEIYHDQLGAARAVWGNQEGLIGILGTGAFAAWYTGEKIVDRKGGHGYLIDDIGGGFELGKIVLSAWLNGDLPVEIQKAITTYVGIEPVNFTTVFYKSPDLKLVAGVARIIIQFLELEAVKSLLVRYFETYFSRHIQPILKNHTSTTLGLVGGIACAFEAYIRLAASKSGISELLVVENPADKLLAYHRDSISKSGR